MKTVSEYKGSYVINLKFYCTCS